MEKLCAEKRQVTSSNQELSHTCKYSKNTETVNYQLQSHIDSPSTNLERTQYQSNEENVLLEGELKHVVAKRERSVAAMDNSAEEHNTNHVSAESTKASNDHQKQYIACLTEYLKLIKSIVVDLQVESKAVF